MLLHARQWLLQGFNSDCTLCVSILCMHWWQSYAQMKWAAHSLQGLINTLWIPGGKVCCLWPPHGRQRSVSATEQQSRSRRGFSVSLKDNSVSECLLEVRLSQHECVLLMRVLPTLHIKQKNTTLTHCWRDTFKWFHPIYGIMMNDTKIPTDPSKNLRTNPDQVCDRS